MVNRKTDEFGETTNKEEGEITRRILKSYHCDLLGITVYQLQTHP